MAPPGPFGATAPGERTAMRLPEHIGRALRESGLRIVITGAGGWIGLATLEMLVNALGPAFAARVCCFGSGPRSLVLRDGTRIEQSALSDLPNLPSVPSLVLHTAFLTKDRVAAMDEAAYVAANGQISALVHDSLDRIGARAIFVASSGAAYRADDPAAAHDFQLYGRLKRDDEDVFARWALAAPGRTAVIARIFNIAGPYINKPETYALASFINDALAGRPIEVRAPHKVVRAYVAVREVIALVIAALLEGGDGAIRFDTGGEPMELAEVAERVAAEFGGGAVRRAALTSAREDNYVGARSVYDDLLRRYDIPPVSFSSQLRETAEYLVPSSKVAGGEPGE
jgi:UDP-glucuronate decarboxylase